MASAIYLAQFTLRSFLFAKLFISLYTAVKYMNSSIFQIELLEEARIFLQNLPQQAHKKMLYNIWRIAGGERNSELFKKLENTEIWEFRNSLSAVCFLGYRSANTDSGYTWNNKENAKDTKKRNSKGGSHNETIF